MPATADNSTVEITINVVDANSGKVFQKVISGIAGVGGASVGAAAKVAELEAEIDALKRKIEGMKPEGIRKIGEHSITALDKVRLLGADLGVRIPRSMEKIIAQSPLAMSAIAGIGTALVAVGGIEILARMGQQVYDLYEKWLDVGRAAREYGKAIQDARDKDLTAPRTIEAAQSRLRTVGTEVGASRSVVEMNGYGDIAKDLLIGRNDLGMALSRVYGAATASKAQYKGLAQSDELQRVQLDQQHRLTQAQIEANHAADGELQGRARVNAELRKKLEILQEERSYNRNVQRAAGNSAGEGDSQSDAEIAAARGSAAAENANIARKERDEVAKARDEAHQAGLQGESRYRAQLQTVIDGYNRSVANGELGGAAAHQLVLAAQEKYDREYQERRRTEAEETARIVNQANSAGNTGLARMDDELQSRLATIAKEAPGYSDPSTRGQREDAARQGNFAEQKKAQDDFSDRIRMADEARTNSSMSANARIATETQHAVAEIRKAWDELYGHLASNDARRVQGQAALNAEIARIQQNGAEQMQRSNQERHDETLKLQAEAGRGGGGDPFRQQRAQIEADADAQARKVQQQIDQADREHDLAAEQDYRDQLVAIRQIANNKELDLAREQRDRLAGELRGFFSSPLEALKRIGEEQASKFAANLLLGVAPGQLTGGRGNGLADLVRPTFNRNRGNGRAVTIDGNTGHVLADHHGDGRATQQATISATTAIIYANGLSFGGGASGGGSTASGGSYVSTGNGGFYQVGGGSGSGGFGPGTGAPEYGSGGSQLSTESPNLAGIGVNDADGNPTSISSEIGSGAGAASQINDASKDLGIKGGLLSKVPGLNKLGSGDDDDGAGGSKLLGGAGAALGVYSAFEGKGGLGGAFSGALSGAKLGSEIGGPVGAAIGAVVGGIAGFIGHGARVQAQKYWLRELQPKVKTEMQAFEQGAADYQSVYDDVQGAETEAKQRTKQMGSGAVDYYNERIKPELEQYQARLTREQKAGRSQYGLTAAQFHNGGPVGAFGSMATSSSTGWIHAEDGEFMLNQHAAASNADIAHMMNAGVSRAGIADYLGGGGGATVMPAAAGDVSMNFYSHDARGTHQLFMDNADSVRAALNQSNVGNSGGSDWQD